MSPQRIRIGVPELVIGKDRIDTSTRGITVLREVYWEEGKELPTTRTAEISFQTEKLLGTNYTPLEIWMPEDKEPRKYWGGLVFRIPNPTSEDWSMTAKTYNNYDFYPLSKAQLREALEFIKDQPSNI
jgi:hypothetical protein